MNEFELFMFQFTWVRRANKRTKTLAAWNCRHPSYRIAGYGSRPDLALADWRKQYRAAKAKGKLVDLAN